MNKKVNTRDFIRKIDALSNAYKRIPTEVATIAVNFSKDRFRERAWLDKTKENWKPRRRMRRGKNNSQTLLVNTGRLKRSIRKISATSDKVVIGTDVPYARIHNEGGTIREAVTVKAHSRKEHKRTRKGRKETVRQHDVGTHTRQMNIKIPARPFIGESYTLQRRILLHISAAFTRALKQ